MKKTIALLLALLMVLALAACGDAPKTQSPVTAETPAPTVEVQTETPAPAVEAQPETEAAEEAVSAEEALGEKADNAYQSELLGIQVSFDDDWYILSEEETAQVMGYVADNTTDESLAKILRENGYACDLYAVAVDGMGDNLNIQLEDLGVVYGNVLTEEGYLNVAQPQLEPSLAQMGIQNVQMERESFFFAGKDRVSLYITGEINGTPVYERMVLIKGGQYMGVIVAFSIQEGHVEEVLSRFEALD